MKLNINDSLDIKIYSKSYWNVTELEIHTNEEYKFEAIGFWKDLFVKCDADGYTNSYMQLYRNWLRSKDNKWFSLIGSLNKSDAFFIGKNNQIKFDESGILFCYANDVNGFYWNNSGYILLKITRVN